jgi:hypothetical protein
MAEQTYKVRDPSGAVREIKGPAGATDEQVIEEAKRLFSGVETPVSRKEPVKAAPSQVGQSGWTPAMNVLQGAADVPFGAAQLLSKVNPATGAVNPGKGVLDDFMKYREGVIEGGRGEEAGTFNIARLLGGLLSPAPLKLGSMIAPAKTFGSRVGQGSTVGAGFGATEPVKTEGDFLGEKGKQIAVAGMLGGPIGVLGHLVGKGAKAGYHLLEPFFEKGRRMIKGREFTRAAGEDASAVLGALEGKGLAQVPTSLTGGRSVSSARPNLELVPGSSPIAGEAAASAGSPGFASLQESAKQVGNVAGLYSRRADASELARQAQIGKVAKTPEALEQAVAQRKLEGKQQFEPLNKVVVPFDADGVQLFKDPFVQRAIRAARDVSASRGSPIPTGKDVFGQPKPLTHGQWDNVRQALRDFANKETDPNKQAALYDVAKRLRTWYTAKVPGAEAALARQAELALPIDRMKAGQEVQNVAVSPTAQYGRITSPNAEAVARTVREQTPKANWTPPEQEMLENVVADYARKARYEDLAKRGGADLEGLAGRAFAREAGGPPKAPMLDRVMMLYNNLVTRVQGRASTKLKEEMAMDMLSPNVVAALMRAAQTPAEKNAIIAVMMAGRLPMSGLFTRGAAQSVEGDQNAVQR